MHGHIIYLDSLDGMGLVKYRRFEETETELIEKYLQPGDSVIDIGAHIGYHTLTMARQVGSNGVVWAFEPHPETFALLKKNIETNGYPNVRMVQQAVSDQVGVSPMSVSDEEGNVFGSVACSLARKGIHSMMVRTTTLDDFFDQIASRFSFIKMDVEGYEDKALKGMVNVLKRNPNLKMLMEFCPLQLAWAGTSPQELLERLSQLGFTIYDIKNLESPVSIDSLLKTYTSENKGITNLFCLRKGNTQN